MIKIAKSEYIKQRKPLKIIFEHCDKKAPHYCRAFLHEKLNII